MDIEVILQHDIPNASAYAILTIFIEDIPNTFDDVIKATEAKLLDVEGIPLLYKKDFLFNHPEKIDAILYPDYNLFG